MLLPMKEIRIPAAIIKAPISGVVSVFKSMTPIIAVIVPMIKYGIKRM